MLSRSPLAGIQIKTSDRWLLGLCVLPFVYLLWTAYYFARSMVSEMALAEQSRFATVGFWLPWFYWVLPIACAVLIPMIAALRKSKPMPRLAYPLWGIGLALVIAETLSYLRVADSFEGGWMSEIHIALKVLPFTVAEGYWFITVRFAMWLAIAVLFIRKCRWLRRQAGS